MRIVITNNQGQEKVIGDTKNFPIPRVGENISVSSLSPKVTAILHDYQTMIVLIIVDGPIL